MTTNLPRTQERVNNIANLIRSTDLIESNPIFGFTSNTNTVNYFDGGGGDSDSEETSQSFLGKKKLKFTDVMNKLDCKLDYIKSGSYGHVFRAYCDATGEQFCVKVVAYAKKEEYRSIQNLQRPENSEICMLKLLSYFVIKAQCPHILLPITVFDTNIKVFLNLQKKEIIPKDNKNYKKFVKNYEKGLISKTVSVIVTEWATEGDLSVFLKKNYNTLTLLDWKCIFFQLLAVLAVIQEKYPQFRHNDLKANNVLLSSATKKKIRYKIGNSEFSVPSCGHTLHIWDFDFACIPGVVENIKVYQEWANKLNITTKLNRYYDVHYFFCSLICDAFVPKIMTSPNVPPEVVRFINYVVPPDYSQSSKSGFVNDKCRLLVDTEYLTPMEILKHEFFKDFRKN